ncbi:MAG: uridine kinase [Bryobacterales bacterium]|nr:uridine kinase [Bryobacterales bacterium]
MPPPYVVGIGGPSGSGKTELARLLVRRLGATHFSLDDYYRDLSHLSMAERAGANFDDPAMFDWDLLEQDVSALSRGEAIHKPLYDFSTHARKSDAEAVQPRPVLIVEGIFALYHEPVRRLFGTAVFVELPDDVCYARRLARDIQERGRSRESVYLQYAATVRPMCERYVLPTSAFADVIVSGGQPVEISADAIEAHMRDRTSGRS